MSVTNAKGLPDTGGPNYIINGAFDIWQRGTSFTGAAARQYFADRFVVGGSTVNTITRQTDVPDNFVYSSKFQRTAASTDVTSIAVTHNFETTGIELAGKTATVSFYAKAGADFSASSIVVQFRSTSVAPSSVSYFGNGIMRSTNADYNAPLNTSFVPTTSWVRYSFTFTLSDLANGLQFVLEAVPTGTAGADDSFYITGVQLEAGSVATPFRRNANSIQGELAACQRYYYRAVTSASAYNVFAAGGADSTTFAIMNFTLPTEQRAIPTVASAGTFGVRAAGSTRAVSSISTSNNSAQRVQLQVTTSSLTAGHGVTLRADNDATAYIEFSAEL